MITLRVVAATEGLDFVEFPPFISLHLLELARSHPRNSLELAGEISGTGVVEFQSYLR